MDERLLTLKEVAEILRLHPRAVVEYVRRGELIGRRSGRSWRFLPADIDAFREELPSSGAYVPANE